MGISLNSVEAFIQGKHKKDLIPFAVVPHIGEVEPVLTLVAHPSKASLKCRRDSVRVRACIGGAEVEIALVPFGEEVCDVVELRLLRRWFHVLELEMLINELLGFQAQHGFHCIRNLWLLLSGRNYTPRFYDASACLIS